jgi:UbiD family decarboxylase
MNHLRSMRDYVEALKEIGEVQEIDAEVDWKLEIGAITRRCYELGAPAPLFNTIKGIEKGFRALGAPAGVSSKPGRYLSRIALSLGLSVDATAKDIIESLVAARDKTPIPPRLVANGPCKENVLVKDDVDLLRLPSPLIHDGDGGRYIGTYGVIVAQTPDKFWTNWAIARVMLVGNKTQMTGVVSEQQHLGMIHKMWKDIGKPMPFALCLGVEPAIPFVAGMELPAEVNEADYIGAFLGDPIEVVQCETVDLQVPATTEIVLEGFLSDNATAIEGPMGEYAGYLFDGPGRQQPVYNVTAMTHRNSPILPVVAAGEPVEENHTVHGLTSAAIVLKELRQNRVPATMAWMSFESANHLMVVTVPRDWRVHFAGSTEQFCREIGRIIFACKVGLIIPKVLVVNDDVDPSNSRELMWAFMTRCTPCERGEIFFNHESIFPLVAYLTTAEKVSAKTKKVIFNCLPPDEWGDKLPRRSSFNHIYPQAVRDKILANWRTYGFA